jgi:hypothetical protein
MLPHWLALTTHLPLKNTPFCKCHCKYHKTFMLLTILKKTLHKVIVVNMNVEINQCCGNNKKLKTCKINNDTSTV